MITYLLNKGLLTEFRTKNGLTLLHFAWSIEIAAALVMQGADVNARDSKGRTPLRFAAQRGDEEMIWFLLSQGAKQDIVDCNGFKPLHGINKKLANKLKQGPVPPYHWFPKLTPKKTG